MPSTLNGFRRDDNGFILATTESGASDDVYVGGLRFRAADGAVRITINSPTTIINGWPTIGNAGVLCVNNVAAVGYVQNGIPFVPLGLVAVANTGTVDHWQNGLPFVGDKLAMVDLGASIHPIAFDDGFSNGFY